MTIISGSHRFIFVHLHKCGGSSVEVAYQPHAKWNDLVIGSTGSGEKLQPIYQKLHGINKHNSATSLKAIVPDVWDDFWKFSVVRHPKSIYESFYKWIHKIVSAYCEAQGISLEEGKQLISQNNVDRPFMQYEVTKPFANAIDFNDFIFRFMRKSTLGTLFDRLSQDGKLIIDDVYKLEDTEIFWRAISQKLNLDIQPTHSNKGSELSKFDWSSENLGAVNEMHAIDYETFGYSNAM
jgi:hypothetical protein